MLSARATGWEADPASVKRESTRRQDDGASSSERGSRHWFRCFRVGHVEEVRSRHVARRSGYGEDMGDQYQSCSVRGLRGLARHLQHSARVHYLSFIF